MLVIYRVYPANAFICRGSSQAKNDLPIFLSSYRQVYRRKKLNKKMGFLETGRECRYLFPRKKIRLQCFGSSPEGPGTRSSYYETWQE
jgi:hypothetical protein